MVYLEKMANGLMRVAGQDVNGESFGDAWNKGYQEYLDYARQELNDGYEQRTCLIYNIVV